MPGEAVTRGDRLALRRVDPEDYPFLADNWYDSGIRGFARNDPEDAEDVADIVEGARRSIYLVPSVDGEPVGFLSLFAIDELAGRAELAFWIAPDEQGQGYATEATELAVQYGFEEEDLQKVTGRVFEDIEAPKRVLEKAGFREEGHLRNHYYVDGEFVDAYLFGILRDEV